MARVLGLLLPDTSEISTESPTAAPTLSDFEFLREMLLPISGDALSNKTTPQYHALDWLFSEDPAMLAVRDTNASVLVERYVMAVLYFSTGGPKWSDDLRFLSNYSICEWPNIGEDESQLTTANEVDCDDNGQVSKLSIENNNLNGTLPSELSALSALQIISLGSGNLHGTIPPQLGDMTLLNFLQFASNSLTGVIPNSFRKLTNMKTISLYNNGLTGTISADVFGNFYDLEVVDFARNNLEGTIPNFITQSPLEIVYLEDNLLEGPLPETIYAQSSLKVLSVSNNQLNGTIGQQLGALGDLRFLWANDNDLTSSIPTTLGMVKGLEELLLDGNALSGTIPSEIGKLGELGRADLSDNRLVGALPKEIGNMESLRIFSVASNELTGSIPSSFSELTSLGQFFLQNTSINEGLDAAYCNQSVLITSIEADCGGDSPEVECECCTSCCENGKDCVLSVPAICQTQKGKFELDTDRGASCSCSENGTLLSCTDTSCESCNLDGSVCAVNTDYGYSFNATTGTIVAFQNSLKYVMGWNDTTIKIVDPKDGSCEVSVNGEKCRSCVSTLVCKSGFEGYAVSCDNLETGYNFNSCDEFIDSGFLEVLNLFDQGQLSGCPLLLEQL